MVTALDTAKSPTAAASLFFSGPQRPSSLRNSLVRLLVALELWFLNGMDIWLRNARELLMLRPTDLMRPENKNAFEHLRHSERAA